mgnify:CR=1 FL=1
MAFHEFGSTVTLTLDADEQATVAILVTAPNGTTSTPAPAFADGLWSVQVLADQYDQWLYTWTVDGAAVDQGSFVVGGPWYATVAELRKTINRRPNDTSADELLALALTEASRSVEQWCDGRKFWLDDTPSVKVYRPSEVGFAGPGVVWATEHGWRLWVHDIGAAGYTVETSSDGTTWTTLTEGVDFETYPDNALSLGRAIEALVSTSGWPARVRVTARWGWPAVPAAVSGATRIQARRLYSRKDSPEGIAGSSEWGLIRVPNLDPDVRALLREFHTEAMIA